MALISSDRQVLLKDLLIEKTEITENDLIAQDSGSILTNKLATTAIELVLPTSQPYGGLYYKFCVTAAFQLKITAISPAFIWMTDSIGVLNQYQYLASSIIGSSVIIEAAQDDQWFVIGMTGGWNHS